MLTGTPERLADAAERTDHEDLIGTVGGFDRGVLLPKTSLIQALEARSKELSADGAEKVLAVGQEARQGNALNVIGRGRQTDRARRGAEPAAEAAKPAAKPYVDEGKEAAAKAYEDALRLAKVLVEKPRIEDASDKE